MLPWLFLEQHDNYRLPSLQPDDFDDLYEMSRGIQVRWRRSSENRVHLQRRICVDHSNVDWTMRGSGGELFFV